ncbi:hypothetical protein [Bacillus smithii]|uniref:hypothetical protein n=1 Tax=Bacillus smithii TaxID=1479 RepID=UPI002E1ECF35|nr:hypothetical protein [Bacillus smithii]MED4926627.1 hypothetical protein [Bacillus smithii]
MATIIDVGIPIDLTRGVFNNVEFINGKLQLSEKEILPNGKKRYYEFGFWESEVIDLIDKFKDFDKIVANIIRYTNDQITIYTRTSNDGLSWTPYTPLNADNTIASPIGRYIQIKVSFTAGITDKVMTVYDFTNSESVNFQNNDKVIFDGSLKLKTQYADTMTVDTSFTDTGTLLRKTINKNQFKSIESIKVQ